MYFCPEPFGPPLSAAAVTNLTLEVIYLLLLFFLRKLHTDPQST